MPRQVLRISVLLAVACLAGCATQPEAPAKFLAAPGSNRQQLFTQGWLFAKEDVSGAQAADYKDVGWRRVDLPHDWSIEGPFDPNLASSTGYLPAGIAWYRKHFTLSPEQQRKNVTVRFDGIHKNSTVYLNGHKLGDRPNGYISFEYDLTP